VKSPSPSMGPVAMEAATASAMEAAAPKTLALSRKTLALSQGRSCAGCSEGE
jgi:hypothetical protein